MPCSLTAATANALRPLRDNADSGGTSNGSLDEEYADMPSTKILGGQLLTTRDLMKLLIDVRWADYVCLTLGIPDFVQPVCGDSPDTARSRGQPFYSSGGVH